MGDYVGNSTSQGKQQFGFGKASDTTAGGGKTLSKAGANFSFNMQAKTDSDVAYRSPRSQAYLDVIAVIDILSATDEEIMEKLKEVLDEEVLEEFSEMSAEEIIEELRLTFEEELGSRELMLKDFPEPEILIGVISQCYIAGCDVHAIDKTGNILEHFAIGRHMPEELAIGRKLFHKYHGKCRCIEIYNNCSRIIADDGSVTRIDVTEY